MKPFPLLLKRTFSKYTKTTFRNPGVKEPISQIPFKFNFFQTLPFRVVNGVSEKEKISSTDINKALIHLTEANSNEERFLALRLYIFFFGYFFYLIIFRAMFRFTNWILPSTIRNNNPELIFQEKNGFNYFLMFSDFSKLNAWETKFKEQNKNTVIIPIERNGNDAISTFFNFHFIHQMNSPISNQNDSIASNFSKVDAKVHSIQINPYCKDGVELNEDSFDVLKGFISCTLLEDCLSICKTVNSPIFSTPSDSEEYKTLLSSKKMFFEWPSFQLILDAMQHPIHSPQNQLLVFTDQVAISQYIHQISLEESMNKKVSKAPPSSSNSEEENQPSVLSSQCYGYMILKMYQKYKSNGIVFNEGTPYQEIWEDSVVKKIKLDYEHQKKQYIIKKQI